jgi:alkyldihydroxyacetonephosphate synthase
VLLGFESSDHPVEPLMARAAEICASFGGLVPAEAMQGRSATDANLSGAAGVWRNFFIKGPEFKEIFTRHGILRETFETACTWRDFPELHADVIDATTRAVRAVCGTGHVACRFTHVYPDGPAPYYTVLARGRPLAPSLVRPPAPRPVRRGHARREDSTGSRRNDEPRRPHRPVITERDEVHHAAANKDSS